MAHLLLHWISLLGWLAVSLRATAPFNQPFQIVRPSADHRSMDVVKEGLAKMQEHDSPAGISLLSVVGPYHSGKSFLLNSLLKQMRAFIVGKATTPETMGIWLCRTSLTAADGSEIWLMDSEGFFGPGIEESYDAKVFTVASLLGSHLVYNTVKIIDQQAVNLLEVLMTQAQLFNARSSVRASGPVPDFLKKESFPPLTWVVEDFVQELPAAFKQEGAFGYLSTYLQGSSGMQGGGSSLGARGNETIITKTFRDVRVAHLFLPATTKEQLQDLSRLEWSQLTQEYTSEVDALRDHLVRNIKARQLNGKAATGPGLAQALRFTVAALQQGMFHELPSLWTSWTTQVAEMSLSDADQWFNSLLQEVDRDEDPIRVAIFNGNVEAAREKAIEFYRNLIRDFNVRQQMGELRKRMDRHFDRKLQTYHERTRRWVSELLTQARESFAKYLSSLVLPMDPAALDKQGKNSSETLTQGLVSVLANFSAPGRRVTTPAGMPVFSQAPATQLANDFRVQLSARSMENDREVERVFKAASSAADEAVEAELRTSGGETLLSKARMDQLKKNAEKACWRAFDERLATGVERWAVNIPKYPTATALIQKEILEARLSRFVAAHEKRLNAHLHTGLQGAYDYYNQRGSALSMPAPSEDLEAQHAQLAAAAQDRLKEYAGSLSDTNAFKEVSRQLAEHMGNGRQQLEEKNVELWKVYSDGATRCAAHANKQRWLECGWFCLFSNVPWWHRSVSRRNLNECFQKDPTSARMSARLQAQVFEVWYTKDLGQASNHVANRFFMILITSVVLFIALWWYRSGSFFWYRLRYGQQYPMAGSTYQQQRMWATGNGYGLRQDPCYSQQQPMYSQQPQYGTYGVTQRRGFFGA